MALNLASRCHVFNPQIVKTRDLPGSAEAAREGRDN